MSVYAHILKKAGFKAFMEHARLRNLRHEYCLRYQLSHFIRNEIRDLDRLSRFNPAFAREAEYLRDNLSTFNTPQLHAIALYLHRESKRRLDRLMHLLGYRKSGRRK